jgi:hypothetical protein
MFIVPIFKKPPGETFRHAPVGAGVMVRFALAICGAKINSTLQNTYDKLLISNSFFMVSKF